MKHGLILGHDTSSHCCRRCSHHHRRRRRRGRFSAATAGGDDDRATSHGHRPSVLQVISRPQAMFVAAWLLMAATAGTAVASEYPERECCDPVNSPPGPMSATPNYAAAAGYETAVTSPSTATAVDGHRGAYTNFYRYGMCTVSFPIQ